MPLLADCDAVTPSLHVAYQGSLFIAGVLVFIGLGIGGAGMISFRVAKTTVNPMRPERASSLVTSGIYRFTRNPMYFGMLLDLAGWCVYLSNPLTFALLPAFILYLNRFQIAPEEKALSSIVRSGVNML